MEDPRANPSLVDDPGFLARLGELDEGLHGDGSSAETPLDSAWTNRPSPADDSSSATGRDSSFLARLGELDEGLGRGSPPAERSAESARGVRRPLLELFPPAPAESGPPSLSPQAAAATHRPPPEPVEFLDRASPPRSPRTCEMFYGLSEPAFDASTDPTFLYSSASHERLAQRLLTAIRRRDGFVLITGPLGVGKTIACRAVVEQIDRRSLTSLLTDPFGSIEDLLRTVLIDFGVISRDGLSRLPATREALMATLQTFLASLSAVHATALVFIDEAQRLPVEVLEQLPRLAPDGSDGLLQLVLIGQPSLTSLLRRPELRELDGQLTVRCALEPLLPDEVLGYVGHRLSVAGSNLRVEFDDEAIRRLFQLSGGVPRTINLICDRALTLGSDQLAHVIDAGLVAAAAESLGVTRLITGTERLVRGVVFGLALVGLGLVGAAGALWVFKAEAMRTVVQWTQTPSAPASPVRDIPTALAPRSAPAEVDASPRPNSTAER